MAEREKRNCEPQPPPGRGRSASISIPRPHPAAGASRISRPPASRRSSPPRAKPTSRTKPPTAAPNSPTPSRPAFTLVELLVVISLLALLLTLLLPSLKRARNQAQALACQARLRQWGLVFKMYTDANEGRWFSNELNDDGLYGPNNWLGLTSPAWFNTRDFAACPRATQGSPDNRYRDAFTA